MGPTERSYWSLMMCPQMGLCAVGLFLHLWISSHLLLQHGIIDSNQWTRSSWHETPKSWLPKKPVLIVSWPLQVFVTELQEANTNVNGIHTLKVKQKPKVILSVLEEKKEIHMRPNIKGKRIPLLNDFTSKIATSF